jgi:hypothetical protein
MNIVEAKQAYEKEKVSETVQKKRAAYVSQNIKSPKYLVIGLYAYRILLKELTELVYIGKDISSIDEVLGMKIAVLEESEENNNTIEIAG